MIRCVIGWTVFGFAWLMLFIAAMRNEEEMPIEFWVFFGGLNITGAIMTG